MQENEITEKEATLYLRNYLGPNGRYPYNQLFTDMESNLAAGRKVHVVSVPGGLMAIGDPEFRPRPWTDNFDRFYETAFDCIKGRYAKKT